ncbi:MAG: antitermination protein NusB [Frateuria sp.]|nr:antitermination protein NusB [Frateuria sp.]NUR22678.1 antitermination protein NusB [Frateuria sp.]
MVDVQAAPYFVGWGTLALINAGLAQGKNRSGLLWFLLSIVFGPLATLVLVLLPKVRQKLF